MTKSVKRLFNDFKPQHYAIDLYPRRSKKSFSGKVKIVGIKTSRPSQRLTFHQSGLKIHSATIYSQKASEQTEIIPSRINHQDSADEVRIHTKDLLYPGKYSIELEFSGKITKAMNGIYPCFFDIEGKEEQLIATQFESHHAREVFPCIDEPEAKATFDLSITTDSKLTVLSNTPIKEEIFNDKNVTTVFETTPLMSTYLLAFVYGKLGYKELLTKKGVVVRTYATPENVQFTDFALDVAVKCLDFYQDYFAIDYPLEKCDMVALPDFASGAMENWGLITYREQCMLVDPNNTSLPTKQYVAMVVAHELAHQWFGNLVTMKWWTDLWLNEGFASWIEYLAVDHIFPDWQMWTQFAVDEKQRALKLDALENTHPIEVPVRHPDEIRTIFDTISYSKGASVINMLNQYLTPDIFRDGLRHYLTQHQYKNTDTVDLWEALEQISGKDVKAFMQNWTGEPGFPLMKVVVNDTSVEMQQTRFFVNPASKAKTNDLWPVPLLHGVRGLPELFGHESKTYALSDAHNFKINKGESGFYRTVYNTSHLEKLGEAILKGQLTPLDRLGILSDLVEAAKAGQSDTADALHFLEVFADEDDNAVWDVISGAIVGVRSVMDDEALRESMNPYIQKLISKQLKILGWTPLKDESHFQSLLRPTILGLAAGADEPSVVQECIKQYQNMSKPEDIAPDVRGIVYTTAARHGDKETYNKLFALHESSTSSEERTTLTAALTSFKQPELIQKALDTIKTDSVRLQDVAYWVAYSFGNRFAKDMTWDWMKKNWNWLYKNLGTDLSFYRFPMFAATSHSNPDFLKEYEEFFVPKINPAFERSIKQGIEVLTWQSLWKERAFTEVEAFFKSKSNQ